MLAAARQQVRCLSHVPVDDIISGLTPEQIEVYTKAVNYMLCFGHVMYNLIKHNLNIIKLS